MKLANSWILCAVVAAAVGCEDNVGLEDDNPARSGAVQPAGNGTAVDEEEACAAVHDALSRRATDLNCPKPKPECPDLIRPAGGDACLQYDQGTVEACVAHIGRYDSCGEFTRSPCIVSTIPGSVSAACTPPVPDAGTDAADAGTGGAGGMAGDAGDAGSMDASLDASDDGAAGAAGSGGAAGADAGSDASSAGSGGAADAGTD